MDPRGLAEVWAAVLGPDIPEDEQRLIVETAKFIMNRWREKANASQDPKVTFRTIYAENRGRALGLVCAVLEASRAIAEGRDPRREMVDALDKAEYH